MGRSGEKLGGLVGGGHRDRQAVPHLQDLGLHPTGPGRISRGPDPADPGLGCLRYRRRGPMASLARLPLLLSFLLCYHYHHRPTADAFDGPLVSIRGSKGQSWRYNFGRRMPPANNSFEAMAHSGLLSDHCIDQLEVPPRPPPTSIFHFTANTHPA